MHKDKEKVLGSYMVLDVVANAVAPYAVILDFRSIKKEQLFNF